MTKKFTLNRNTMMSGENWQAVFFDCDGVILDSVGVKTNAFAKMFSQYGPEVEAAVVKYHLENGGVSRYEKFRYYYENLLHLPVDEDQILELGKTFSSLVVNEVIASPFIRGAFETIVELKSKEVPLYLVSGTPKGEMIEIAERKGFSIYFDEIHGSPGKKWDIVADILARKGYDPDKCLFLGDAMSDYEAARRNNLYFIGIVPKNTPSVFPPGTCIQKDFFLQSASIPDL